MRRSLLALVVVLVAAPVARAEIAVLANGMTLKLDTRRLEGETVVMELRGGGEVAMPASFIRGFVPDEVLEEITPDSDTADLRSLATDAARRHGLDPELVLAVVGVESAFRVDAVSPKGALGLMQLMPATAASLGVQDAFDPAANLDGGSRHLQALLAMYKGDLKKALAAYNAGAGAVKRHRGVPPYRETREYVDKVMRRYKPAKNAKKKTK
jgi:membrane-bound lytic murein transglycosylase MltF